MESISEEEEEGAPAPVESTTVQWSHGPGSYFGKKNLTGKVEGQTVGASILDSLTFPNNGQLLRWVLVWIDQKVFIQIVQLFFLAGKTKRTKVFFEISADNEPVGRIEMELFDEITPRWRENTFSKSNCCTNNNVLQDS